MKARQPAPVEDPGPRPAVVNLGSLSIDAATYGSQEARCSESGIAEKPTPRR
jgi:hypothetical protein